MVFLNNTTNVSLPTTQQPSEELAATTIASAIFLVLVMLLTIFGNSLVCYSVVSYYRLRSPTNYFVVSLAVSDFLVGIVILPFRLTQTLNNHFWPASLGREGCQFWIWMDILCSGASIVNLAGISIDRLLAIKRPLKYREEMTSKRALLVILFVWVYAFLAACLLFVDWGQDTIAYQPQCGMKAKIYITLVSFACFFCPLLIVVVCYGHVLHVAMRHAIQLQREKDSIAVSFSSEPNGNQEDGEQSDESTPYLNLKNNEENDSRAGPHRGNTYVRRSKSTASTFNIMKQIKATKTLAIVVGVFIICWFPFFVIYLTFQYCGNECFDPPRLSPQTKTAILNVFVYVLPVSNSAANPIIYSCFNQEFRQAFLKIFYKMAGKSYKPKPPSWEISYISR